MANMIATRAAGRKWTVASETHTGWNVRCVNGWAHGSTPRHAVDWAYADGRGPARLFATKGAATDYITDYIAGDD